jgi:hypothetical protein
VSENYTAFGAMYPQQWNNSLFNMSTIWVDEATSVDNAVFSAISDGYSGVSGYIPATGVPIPEGWGVSQYSWGPNGYGDPFDGFWRDRHGDQVEIATMESSYIKNCMSFLINKFGHEEVKGWRVYKTLLEEIAKRGINERTDWDGEENQSSTDS